MFMSHTFSCLDYGCSEICRKVPNVINYLYCILKREPGDVLQQALEYKLTGKKRGRPKINGQCRWKRNEESWPETRRCLQLNKMEERNEKDGHWM